MTVRKDDDEDIFKGISGTKPSEIKEIMEAMGRKEHEGDIKGQHFAQILTTLQIEDHGILSDTISGLAVTCGMKARYVKEDSINGLIYLGVIDIATVENKVMWKWRGIKGYVRRKKERQHDNGGDKLE